MKPWKRREDRPGWVGLCILVASRMFCLIHLCHLFRSVASAKPLISIAPTEPGSLLLELSLKNSGITPIFLLGVFA